MLNETIDVLLVANKVDLLPTQCTRTRVTSFARRRAKALGLQRASGVHLVSAHTGMGTTVLAEQLEQLLDEGKEAWVVGAQNAGKSSLINRLSQKYGKVNGSNDVTWDVSGGAGVGPLASHLPGTTLGVVRAGELVAFRRGRVRYPRLVAALAGELALKQRGGADGAAPAAFDATHVPRGDRLDGAHRRPRARRRLGRPAAHMYLTVWASADVPINNALNGFAKAEGGKADTLFAKHAGTKLVPPIGQKRVSQLGEWGSRVVTVYGSSWQRSDRDVVIGGLGWVGVGVNGEAALAGLDARGRPGGDQGGARAGHGARPAQTGLLGRDVRGRGRGDGGKRPSKRVKRRGGKR